MSRKHQVFGLACVLGMLSACGCEARPTPVLPPSEPLIQSNSQQCHPNGTCAKYAKVSPLAQSPAGPAMRVQVTTQPSDDYEVELNWTTTRAAQKGHTLLLQMWIRRSDDSPAPGEASLLVQQDSEPWRKFTNVVIPLSSQWRKVAVPVRLPESFKQGQLAACVWLGQQIQTVDVAGVELLDFGPNITPQQLPQPPLTYAGRDHNASWRKEAQKRIEQIRKGPLEVRVVGPDGKAIGSAEVHVQMLSHEFRFGTAVQSRLLMSQSVPQYRQTVLKYFNEVVFENEMKWPNWESNQNHSRLLDVVKDLRNRGLTVRGHNLVWPATQPSRLPDTVVELLKAKDSAGIERLIREHIADIVGYFRGMLADWDVVNEPVQSHAIQDLLGPGVIANWFRWAHQADGNAKLYLNDYVVLSWGGKADRAEALYRIIESLKSAGAPIDAVGEQGHYNSKLLGIEDILRRLDRLSKLGLPIKITEFDVNVTDEQLQADFLRDFYTAAFSQPAVNGILMWGFWENAHWRPDAALWRADWSIKPNGQAFLDLVYKTWWTDLTGKTDGNGRFTTRGFLGQYQITVSKDGVTKVLRTILPKQGASITITLPPAK